MGDHGGVDIVAVLVSLATPFRVRDMARVRGRLGARGRVRVRVRGSYGVEPNPNWS